MCLGIFRDKLFLPDKIGSKTFAVPGFLLHLVCRSCQNPRPSMLNHVFTTPVLRETTTLSPEQLADIRDYLLSLQGTSEGDAKSNRGGWHSKGNLFSPEHTQFPILRGAVTTAMFNYIGEVFGFRGEIQLALTGWTVINRPGDYNVPHNHAANLLSGALYICLLYTSPSPRDS